MPKYCSVPNCRNGSGNGAERKSFYRFPLQEPLRLQQWLRNMGRENWTPSRHQYICHEHFAPSCFRVRWGIRYIEKNAVPTIFQQVEKRKATDQEEKSLKRRRGDGEQSSMATDDRSFPSDAVETQSSFHAVHLLETFVEPSEEGNQSLSDTGVSDWSLHTDVEPPASGDEHEADLHVPLTLFQAEDELSHGEEDAEVLLMSGEGQDELVKAVTAAILSQGHRLIINNNQLVAVNAAEDVTYATEEFLDVQQGEETQIFAYYETPPLGLMGQFSLSPETVLSNALSSKPIASTLPIVSKLAETAPAAPVLCTERAEADEDRSEEEDTEQQDHQLEEHCYHKNSLSKEQLEAMVAELQKKVKVLQQRHRRHLEKLVGLENTVSQLRQNNLLNEERLQLLERAYVQTSSAMSDAGETVTIIYEEDDGAYLYTPLNSVEAEL